MLLSLLSTFVTVPAYPPCGPSCNNSKQMQGEHNQNEHAAEIQLTRTNSAWDFILREGTGKFLFPSLQELVLGLPATATRSCSCCRAGETAQASHPPLAAPLLVTGYYFSCRSADPLTPPGQMHPSENMPHFYLLVFEDELCATSLACTFLCALALKNEHISILAFLDLSCSEQRALCTGTQRQCASGSSKQNDRARETEGRQTHKEHEACPA